MKGGRREERKKNWRTKEGMKERRMEEGREKKRNGVKEGR